MLESIEYQAPLPAGYRLRYVNSEDGISISREPPGTILLFSEACVPLVLLLGAILLFVLIRRIPNRLNLSPEIARIVLGVGYILLATWIFVNCRRGWQNMGIVTIVAVSGGSLYWQKQNLWGSKEFFWPLSTIKGVRVQNRMLRVHRSFGPALAAFSFVKPDERAYAANLLNGAIATQRTSGEANGRGGGQENLRRREP